ncbi:hypothetical protein OIDMADRAFT_142221 [Oidiodendron maius Zn]|uniref:Fork-head domain-containing protein n=1 Tax=Oidiodendron maius (strain Zn) TaxID=913774 RepID=A0A0C3DX66_OIDMZ|nr:hypothetical protein OIDMADRAFT_142221 [Oidiodendron maius Zn]
MTSPHASPADGDTAAATVAMDDNTPNQLELTADLQPEQEAAEPPKEEPSNTMPPEDIKQAKEEAQDVQMHEAPSENPNRTTEAAIPSGAEPLHDAQNAFSADPLNGLARLPLDVFNPAMPQQPISIYDTIDGLPYPPDPTRGAEGLLALQMAMNASANQNPFLDQAPYPHDLDETRISAYAKLEFEDGEFYMNTHQVILGRDLTAARAAMRRDQEEEKQKIEDEVSGAAPFTPVQAKRTESKYTKSVVSESGGILREGDDSDPETRRKRRSRKASKKSKSTGSSSHDQSRRNSIQQNGLITYQAQSQVRRSAPETAGAVPVDPASLRPSPHDCPLVGIHPPAITPASGYKAISRKHVKIAYNSDKHLFEAHIIGRNGAFVDDEFRYHNDVIQLKSGSRLQIGGVVVRFVLPDVAIGETGAEQKPDYEENGYADRYSEGGKEMSFDFEDTPRDGVVVEETSEDEFEEEVGEVQDDRDEDSNEEEEGERHENGDLSDLDDMEEREERKMAASLLNSVVRPEKKRGPGRPPKNGIMSKREQQLVKKEAQAQAQALQKAQKSVSQGAGPAPTKNKVGRPRKHPKQPTPEVQREKRKYTKRKPKEPKDPNVKQEGSGDDQPVKEKKEKKEKPPKPPRSPSPTFNEADLTPEQLAKPQANYVSLIFDALSNSPTGQMSLPQIYRAIMRKYPFFVLKTTTNGWQSSVRHNLSQHHAFRKVERDGKGWMWAIVDGSTIEKEKKKKASPPPQLTTGHMHHQQILQAGHPPHMMQGPPYGPGLMGPPPGYPINQPMPPNMHPGQPQPYIAAPHQMQGPPAPPGSVPLSTVLPPPGYSPSVPPQLAGPSTGTYSSPYAPKPNPPTSQLQPSEQRPTAESRPPAQAPNSAATPQQQYRQQQPPQPVPSQQTPQNPPSGPPPPNEKVLKFLETFKATVIKTLKEKTSNAEAIVNSAVNRTLGITTESTVPGNTHEDMLISILRNSLSQIPDSNVKPNPPQSGPSDLQPSEQRPAQASQANQSEPQGNAKAAGPDKPGPTVMRPSFTGQSQNRPNTTSVSRPPMMTPGIKRNTSGSPANAPARISVPSSASPAPPPSTVNGASTPTVAITEAGQVAGQKRPHEDGDDIRDLKRLSTSGPPQVKT